MKTFEVNFDEKWHVKVVAEDIVDAHKEAQSAFVMLVKHGHLDEFLVWKLVEVQP